MRRYLTTGSTARAASSFGEVREGSMIEMKCLRSAFPHTRPSAQSVRHFEGLNLYQTVIVILLMAATSSAQAANWVQFSETLDGKEQYLIDVSSIQVSGSIRQAWVKDVFAPKSMWNVRIRNGRETKIWIDYQLMHDFFNCSDHTFRPEEMIVHLQEGLNQKIPANMRGTGWLPIHPASTAAVTADFICAWKGE